MKTYRSHKIVQAARIIAVDYSGTRNRNNPLGQPVFRLEDGTDHFDSRDQFRNAQVGGYVVEYKGGYRSYSPAQAFEEGYTLLPPAGSQVDPSMSLPSMRPQFNTYESMDHAQLGQLGQMLGKAEPNDAMKDPSVSGERIDMLVASLTYETAQIPGTTSTVATARMPGGFVVAIGHSACVSPRNFDAEKGRLYAIENATLQAREKLWEFEGYVLASQLGRAMVEAPAIAAGVPFDLVRKLSDLIAIQLQQSVDRDDYMRGLANGLILALATVENKEPQYVSKPKNHRTEAVANLVEQGKLPHQVRVFEEKWELDERLERLQAFLVTPMFARLDDAEQARLDKQVRIMRELSEVLAERIAAF